MPIEDNISGIYFIRNVISGKYYIGSSINIRRRFYQYKYKLSKNKCHSPKLQSAYNKYGLDNFYFGLIEECSALDLKTREQYWIHFYDSVKKGYNCSDNTICSTRGMKHTIETRKKMSEAQKILTSTQERKKLSSKILIAYNKSQKNIPKSEEHRSKISLANTGKKMPTYAIKILSERMRKNPITYWKGKKRSIEDRKKMSDAHKGIVNLCLLKPIIQFNLNMVELNSYKSTQDASTKLNISRTSIKNCLNGYSKTAGGFIFKFK